MKHAIYKISLILALLFSTAMIGQGHNRERIKSLKIAFITEKLALTSEEAQKFWPIYNIYDDNSHQLRNVQLRKIKNKIRKQDLATLSDKEALKILDEVEVIESKLFNEKRKLTEKLRKAISPKKIILLKKVEDDFNRELLKRLREKRRQRFEQRN